MKREKNVTPFQNVCVEFDFDDPPLYAVAAVVIRSEYFISLCETKSI